MAICWAEMGSCGRYHLFSISVLFPFLPQFIETQFVGESVPLSHSQSMKEMWSKSSKPTVLILLPLASDWFRTRQMCPFWPRKEMSFGHLPGKMFLPAEKRTAVPSHKHPSLQDTLPSSSDMVVEVHDVCSSYKDTEKEVKPEPWSHPPWGGWPSCHVKKWQPL